MSSRAKLDTEPRATAQRFNGASVGILTTPANLPAAKRLVDALWLGRAEMCECVTSEEDNRNAVFHIERAISLRNRCLVADRPTDE